MKYTIEDKETRNPFYILRKPRMVYGKKYYLYIQFNTRSREHNPIIVTDLQYRAFNSPMFISINEALEFMVKFFNGKREDLFEGWEFVEYKPANSKNISNIDVTKIGTKYGKCYKVSSVDWRY